MDSHEAGHGKVQPIRRARESSDERLLWSRFREAEVGVVDKVVDAASGTFGVRLELPNPDTSLPAGLKCRVRF